MKRVVCSSTLGMSLLSGVALFGPAACTSAPSPSAAPGSTAPTVAATLGPAVPAAPAAAATQASMRSFPLNTYKRQLDGQWEGIRLASDGNVYFASSSHSAHHGGSFFK